MLIFLLISAYILVFVPFSRLHIKIVSCCSLFSWSQPISLSLFLFSRLHIVENTRVIFVPILSWKTMDILVLLICRSYLTAMENGKTCYYELLNGSKWKIVVYRRATKQIWKPQRANTKIPKPIWCYWFIIFLSNFLGF